MFLVCCTRIVQAQHFDLTGNWIGTAIYPKKPSQYKHVQNGKENIGSVLSKNINTNYYIKVRITGEINKHDLELRGKKVIYKLGCTA